MVAAVRHRGPDDVGTYVDERVALGHARLAIIDLATGQQPMSDGSGTLWAVFNGEIFNYLELRDELRGLGRRFRTESDTEVVMEAFAQWGDDAFERFNGQFALAMWNTRSGTLTLARDRFGVRPIYLAEHGGRLWFGSEVKALFVGDRAIPRALDPAGLAEVFTFWTTIAPQTVFQGVTELEPGHVLTLTPDGRAERAFWTPAFPPRGESRPDLSFEAATEQVRSALEAAVRLRILRADVPVGSYLSGGMDSSLVAALGRSVKGDRFSTFSIRFEDAEYDETRFQQLMASRLGSDHQDLVVRRRDIADVFPEVIAHTERPILRTAPAPMFLLSRLVRQAGVKVVLTGEGADELFGGYDLFREGRIRRFWARRPGSRLRPRLLDRLYPYLSRSPVAQRAIAQGFFGRDLDQWAQPGFAHGPRWQSAAALQRLFAPDVRRAAAASNPSGRLLGSLPAVFGDWSFLAQDEYLEIRTLLSGYILSSQGDRMLMAHSVEGRFPFLDTSVVDLAATLPDRFKIRGLDEKHILKAVAAGLLPDEIVHRVKQPYRAPEALSFVGEDRPSWVDDLVDRRAVARAGIFDPDGVERLWQKCRASSAGGTLSNADNMALVGVLSTALLDEGFIRSSPVVDLDRILVTAMPPERSR
jgi:asparagine synthase (glutamine-hydrolysing)